MTKRHRAVKHRGRKEHIADFHKFRGLKGQRPDFQRELGPVALVPKQADHQKKAQPQTPVKPRDIRKLPDPFDDKGNDQGKRSAQQHKHELTQRPFKRNPG